MADVTLDLRLNSQSFLADLANARSQAGMTLGGPMAAASSGMGLAAAGAATGLGQMAGGFGRPSFGFGQAFGFTHTPQDIGLNPHYGNIHAYSTGQMEAQIERHGLAAAAALAPPGVAPAEFAMSVQQNRIEREVQSQTNAQLAARSTGFGMAAGMGADIIVGGVAAYGLGKLGGALGGAVGAGIGKFAGGFGVGMLAWDVAQEMVADHYAKVEQIGGYTRELGEIAGSGRGLSRLERYNLGVAARGAAKDINMDVNTMGDILATAGAMNMMPDSTDPSKARQQFSEFAKTIREGAQVLQSSLAEATQVIKQATEHGMTAREGIVKAAGMGGAGAFGRYIAFGEQGAGVARSMRYTGGQGFALFTGALGQMSGAGLSNEEMQIMGGRYGAASFLGSTQMAVAQSGVGRMQLMAAMGGGELGGLMDMPGQALASMGGGDMMTNLASFMVNEDEYRRGIGARGIRTMARQQITAGAEFVQDFMGLDTGEARRFAAMQMYGMNATQAKAYVGGLFSRGGGPDRYEQQARAALALQNMDLSQGITPLSAEELEKISNESGFDWGYAKAGAIAGGTAGSIVGTPFAGGLVGTAVGGTVGAIADVGEYVFGGDHPDLFASAEEKADFYQRRDADRIDREMKSRRARYGYAETTEGDVAAFLSEDVSGLFYGSPGSSGLAGRGRVLEAFYGTSGAVDAQRIARKGFYTKKTTRRERNEFVQNVANFYQANENASQIAKDYVKAREEMINLPTSMPFGVGEGPATLAAIKAGALREQLVAAGIDPESRAGKEWLQKETGTNLSDMPNQVFALIGGEMVTTAREQRSDFIAGVLVNVGYGEGVGLERQTYAPGPGGKMVPVRNSQIAERSTGVSAFLEDTRIHDLRRLMSNGKVEEANRLKDVMAVESGAADLTRYGLQDEIQLGGASRRQAKRIGRVAEVVSGVAEAVGLDKVAAAAKGVSEAGERGTVTLEQLINLGKKDPDQQQAAKRSKRRGVENAIGFGAREESMELINKSLRRTHNMIEQQEKRIVKLEEK